MAFDAALLTRPVGPLPLWGWGALAAGGVVLIMARRGVPAAAAVVDPNTAVPAAPLAADPTAPPPQPVAVLNPGQSVYDPNTGQATPPISVSDLIGGGNLSDFIGKLGPDYANFSFNSGTTGLSVSHSAQNVLDAQTAQNYQNDVTAQTIANYQGYWQNQVAAQQPYYATQTVANSNLLAGYQAYLASLKQQITAGN